jgi:hypothetical protein
MKPQIVFVLGKPEPKLCHLTNVLAIIELRGYDLKKFGVKREEVSCHNSRHEMTRDRHPCVGLTEKQATTRSGATTADGE